MLAEGNASAIQKKMLMKMIESVSKVGMVWTFAFRISGLILVCLVLGVVRLIRTIKGDSLWRLRERVTETLPTSTAASFGSVVATEQIRPPSVINQPTPLCR